jgi:hypothetical protein
VQALAGLPAQPVRAQPGKGVVCLDQCRLGTRSQLAEGELGARPLEHQPLLLGGGNGL